MTTLLPIALISFTWLVCFLVFAGVGALISRPFGVKLDMAETWLLAFWVGWAACIGLMQVWSFVLPINDALRVLVVILALVGLFWNRHDAFALLRTMTQIKTPLVWGMVTVTMGFTVWLANRSVLAPNDIYDTGLYHLNAVRWSMEYPVVPGLGLLHSRLAFSNAYFLYPALLDVSIWADRTYHIANGLLMWVLFLQGMVAFVGAFQKQNAYPIESQALHAMPLHFSLLTLPVILFLVLTERTVPSISNDPPVFALGIIVAGQVLRMIQGDRLAYRVFVVTLLAAVGITVKFSFGVLGVGYAVVGFGLWWRAVTKGEAAPDVVPRRLYGVIAILTLTTALVIIPMMGRSVMMTGHALYPYALIAFPVEWRLSDEAADFDTDTIRAWSRAPEQPADEVLSNWDWLGGWVQNVIRQYFHVWIPVGLVGLSLLMILGGGSVSRRNMALFLLPPLAALIFWFFSAPAIRFAIVLFWLIGLGAFVFALESIENPRWRWLLLGGVILVMLLPSARLFIRDPWVAPGPDDGFYPITEPDLERFTTHSGLELWIPADGGEQCWDSPLPCMAFPSRNLRLRVAGDVSQGFAGMPEE